VGQELAGSKDATWVTTEGPRHRRRLEEAERVFRSLIGMTPPQREAYRGLGYSLMWLGRGEEGRGVLRAGIAAGLWRQDGQHPGQLDTRLPSQPFPNDERTSCVTSILEASGQEMAAEAMELLQRSAQLETTQGSWDAGLFRKEREGLQTPSDGFAFYEVLTACAVPEEAAHLRFFCAALAALRSQGNVQVGLARISRLQPGVHISIHTGLFNTRWRAHLGLKLPRSHNARLWVAQEPGRWWEVGKAFIFDDSFEHSVRWDAPIAVDLSPSEARLVFILDFSHPDLAPSGQPICPPVH